MQFQQHFAQIMYISHTMQPIYNKIIQKIQQSINLCTLTIMKQYLMKKNTTNKKATKQYTSPITKKSDCVMATAPQLLASSHKLACSSLLHTFLFICSLMELSVPQT
jgi:predicted transcriptional regulator